jgi:Tol biopolymer transport system component
MMHRILSRVLGVSVALTVLATVAQPLPVAAAQVVRKLSDAMPAFGDIDIGDLRRATISPDGRHVVYVADQATDEARELWSVAIDGQSPPVRLSGPLPSGTGIDKFVIAPDSEHVVYRAAQDSADVNELYSVPIAGGAITKLNGPMVAGGDVDDFQITPDASRVVYKGDQVTDRGEIFSVPISGGAQVRLSGTLVLGGNLFDFDITPDGNRVVYKADQQVDSLFELYSVPIGGGAFTNISNGANVNGTVGITPDSSRIVYTATFSISTVSELFSVPVTGGVPVQLNTPLVVGRVVSGARLSPDGSRVVYVADEAADDVFEMFSVPAAGGTRVKLNGALVTGGDVSASTPTFNPDGTHVVYVADQLTNDMFELFSVPVGGGLNTKLNAPFASDRDVDTFGTTITDKNRVIFTADQDTNDVDGLYSVPLLGGATTKLSGPLVADGRIDSFKVSPDGSRVLYSASQNVVDQFELFSVPVSGGAVTAVSGVMTSGGSVEFGFGFSPDGLQVLYVADQDVDEINELYLSFDETAQPQTKPPLIPLVPARLLDTRPGESTIDHQFEGIGRRDAGSTLELTIAGRGGVPVGAAAAVLNVTAVDASGSGFVTVYPCDAPRPLASSLNYTPGATTPNEVIAKLSATGTVCLFTFAAVHLVADVTGGVPKPSAYLPLVPARLLDTRPGETTIDHQFEGQGIRQAGSTLELPITARGGVGGGAVAAVVNITAVNATTAGFVTVYPCDEPRPLASSLNYVPGTTTPNEVIAKLAATGTICLFTLQPVDLVVDVTGAVGS